MSFDVSSNAPEMLMEYMNINFHQCLDNFVVVFTDDIMVYSKTNEEHVDHLRVMLKVLQEKHLYTKLSKCRFRLIEVSFLGQVTSSGGIVVDSLKVKLVRTRFVLINYLSFDDNN